MADQSIRCPKCSQSDQVRKVSAIVRGRTITTSGTFQTHIAGEYERWTSTPYAGTQTPHLVRELTPPSKPPMPSTTGLWVAVLIGIPILGSVFFFGLSLVLELYFGPGSSRSVSRVDTLVEGVTGVIVGTFMALAVIGLAYINYSKKKRQAQDMLPRWEHAMTKWNQLYYCERDDILFNPEDGRSMPITEMTQYLYS